MIFFPITAVIPSIMILLARLTFKKRVSLNEIDQPMWNIFLAIIDLRIVYGFCK